MSFRNIASNARLKTWDPQPDEARAGPQRKEPGANKPRNRPNIALKIDFIKEVREVLAQDPKASMAAIGRKYGFSSQLCSYTMSRADEYISKAERAGSNAAIMSNLSTRPMAAIEHVAMLSYKNEVDNKRPVNDKRLLELVLEAYMSTVPFILPKYRPKDIDFSSGWIRNFKVANNLKMYTGHGEEGDVDMVANKPKFEAIAEKLAQFHPSDIYNCDETGLYLKALSNRTLSKKPVAGRKAVRDARVSILLCCNADGTDKRPLFVLSAHEPKGGLDEVVKAQMRTDFKGNGYMTFELFKEWLDDFDADIGRQGRKVALLMDNAPGHGTDRAPEASDSKDPVTSDNQAPEASGSKDPVPSDSNLQDNPDTEGEIEIEGLKNITLIRLPPRTTSVAQPLDAGIIRSFKVKYSRRMIWVISSFQTEAGDLTLKAQEKRDLTAKKSDEQKAKAATRAAERERKDAERVRKGLPPLKKRTTAPKASTKPAPKANTKSTPKARAKPAPKLSTSNTTPRKPAVPNSRFYPCFVQAWADVSLSTIRNCFAHVPTIPKAMREQLRMPVEDDRDHEMSLLKKELRGLYPARASLIDRQKDYGVLAFLKSCDGQGPQPRIMESIKSTASSKEYAYMFVSPEDVAVLGEDESEDDPDDLDYDPRHPDMRGEEEEEEFEAATGSRMMRLRGGNRLFQFQESIPSSQESQERAPEKPVKSLKRSLKHFTQAIEKKDLNSSHARSKNARKKFLFAVQGAQRLIEAVSDVLALELDNYSQNSSGAGNLDSEETDDSESDTTDEDTTTDVDARLHNAVSASDAYEDTGYDEYEDDLFSDDNESEI